MIESSWIGFCPPHVKRMEGHTTVAIAICHLLDIKDRTACESGGNANPSQHELWLGTRYRHTEIHAPPSQ